MTKEKLKAMGYEKCNPSIRWVKKLGRLRHMGKTLTLSDSAYIKKYYLFDDNGNGYQEK